MATHSSILAWEIPWDHGQRSLVGYSPWGCKEIDRTEGLGTQREIKMEILMLSLSAGNVSVHM